MRKTLLLLSVLLLIGSPLHKAQAQTQESLSAKSVVYSLPRTTLHLKVQARCQQFTAGPYAAYAKKYLGVEAPTQNSLHYSLQSVEVSPLLEADPAHVYQLSAAALRGADLSLLQVTAQGLIIMADSPLAGDSRWRFAPPAEAPSQAGMIDHLQQEHTTLYQAVEQEGQMVELPVQQTITVTKNPEQQAQEAARIIFQARTDRMKIVTGDTDATYAGEALGAAMAELRRVEAEYLRLFMGTTKVSTQSLSFDVVPEKDRSQKYIAFRLSPTGGLTAPDDISGRPIVLELTAEAAMPTAAAPAPAADVVFYYRLPQVMQLRLLDGETPLLQTRVPVYQLGTLVQFPVPGKK